MAIKELVPSRDWVNVINQNFNELVKKSETAPIVLGEGWSTNNNSDPQDNKVMALPMNNGKTLKILRLSIHNPSVKAGADYSHCITLPNDWGTVSSHPIGNHITIENQGHFQGSIEFYGADYYHIGCGYHPMDGQGGPYDVYINATLLYL